MKYIIDEEELNNIFDGEKPRFDVFEPIEMIASGEVIVTGYRGVINSKVGNTTLNVINNELSKFNGKSIKIYIESE